MSFPNKKISGIILAAGSASRMGKTKQLLPFEGTTLLGQVVKNARESALYEIIIVLGHNADKISQTLEHSKIKIVRNKDFLKGQSTSLIKGLENVSPDCDAAMFILGDQPLVTAPIINTLIAAFENSNARIVIPYYKDRRGNPVPLARPMFHILKSLSDDRGARALFDKFKESILKVQIPDNGILIDVDTMDDYKRLIYPGKV